METSTFALLGLNVDNHQQNRQQFYGLTDLRLLTPFSSLVSDSKGVYDALNNELPQDDKKAAVEMPIIEELLSRSFGRSRWVPHNFNPSEDSPNSKELT